MTSWYVLVGKSTHGLVNWVEAVSLCGDAKVDALVTPFVKGEMEAPGAPVSRQPGYVLLETCREI